MHSSGANDPTPLSPLEKSREVPRAPTAANCLHTRSAYERGTLCSSSPYEVEMTLGIDLWSRSQFTQARYGSFVLSGVEALGLKGGLYVHQN